MALPPGSKLGHFEIVAAIGSGGMGEVYRATDTTLKRDVAIKLLPEVFARDAERVARFKREAQLLAALNHPHIATIHGLFSDQVSEGQRYFLVMELVGGQTLAETIRDSGFGIRASGTHPSRDREEAPTAPGPRGGLPIDDALHIARQICEALEHAHEHGVIHRDLKPANVKLTLEGKVKVLDFGLAKAFAGDGTPAGEASPGQVGGRGVFYADSQSPTLGPSQFTASPTIPGVILGTAAYMSPEQARGKPVDRRTDIWALGAVLYELLTGKQAFQGEDVTEILAAVVKSEPDWSALPSEVPPAVRVLVARCLAKDRKQRMRDIGDVQHVLNGAFEVPTQPATVPPVPAPPRPLWKRAMPAAVAAVAASIILGVAAWMLRPPMPSSPVMRFALPLGENQQFGVNNNQILAVSQDGTKVVYAVDSQLYVRSLSELEARPIPGTQGDGSGRLYSPVFSPDSQSIAFFTQLDSTIKRISVSGGAAVTLCPARGTGQTLGRVDWDANGIIFSEDGRGIMRVSANGGTPEVLVAAKEGEMLHGFQLLPGGEWALLTVAKGTAAIATAETWDKAEIVVQSMKSSERRTVISGGSDGRYLPTGHIVYALGGVLFAAPFDLGRLAINGGPVPIVEGVRRSVTSQGRSGVAQFSVSSNGSLVFIPGPVSPSGSQKSIGLFDRKGARESLEIQPGPYELPRMSPDGKRIAFGSNGGKEASIWVYELSGNSSMRRLTFEGQGHNRFPVWSPDSQRVAFQSDREGDRGIFQQRADGTGTAERLTKAEEGTSHIPESWAAGGADGERMLYNAGKVDQTALWVLSLKDKKASRFGDVESPANTVTGAVFSPDMRWVAYASREGRTRSAVYVQPFPPTGAKYQISKDNEDGHHPVWSPDGAEFFYTPGPGTRISAVRITMQPSFSFGEATVLPRPFQNDPPSVESPYDISRDGQRFLALSDATQTQAGAPVGPQIQIVLNWFEELKQKVPVK